MTLSKKDTAKVFLFFTDPRRHLIPLMLYLVLFILTIFCSSPKSGDDFPVLRWRWTFRQVWDELVFISLIRTISRFGNSLWAKYCASTSQLDKFALWINTPTNTEARFEIKISSKANKCYAERFCFLANTYHSSYLDDRLQKWRHWWREWTRWMEFVLDGYPRGSHWRRHQRKLRH